MANYLTSSLLVTLQMLDTSGNATYVGNDNNITLWGAQLELGENFQDLINDLDNYLYIRTRGVSSNNIGIRFGADYTTDAIALPDPTKLFVNKRAQRDGETTSILLNINNSSKVNAPQIAEDIFVNYKAGTPIAKKWYQLAPYYSSYIHLDDRPTDYDLVRVGARFAAKRTSNDSFESLAFLYIPSPLKDTTTANTTKRTNFIDKTFNETRQIPQVAKYDAAAVAGVYVANKTAKTIDLNKYTPLSSNINYYKQYDWYSEAPLYNRARFAIGNAGIGPVMIDNMQLGDSFTYTGSITLQGTDNFVKPGTQLGGLKFGGDPLETTDVNLKKQAKQSVFTDLYIKNRNLSPLDADQVYGIFYNSSNNVKAAIRNNPYKRRWYQLAPYYNSFGHIKNSEQDYDRVILSYKEIVQPWFIKGIDPTVNIVTVGGVLGRRTQTGESTVENTAFFVNQTAKRSALTTSNVVVTSKINWISYSENFNADYWNKTNMSVVSDVQLMSGKYPYRNTNFDANAVAKQFFMLGTSSSYTRYNNYYRNGWYLEAPVINRQAFSSTVLQYLSDQDTVGQHAMTATALLNDYSIPEEYFTFSLYVQRQNNVQKFRMDVGRLYTDFDLSSVSVVTSTTGILYATIRTIDTALGVYLCQMIGPIRTFKNELIILPRINDTQTIDDNGITFLFRDFRTFNDSVTAVEFINNDKITDYMSASGTFDYEALTGNFDYQLQAEYPDFDTSVTVLETVYPSSLYPLGSIYGYESLMGGFSGLELIS